MIVGYSSKSSQQVAAVRWSSGTISTLGQLPGGPWSIAEDVNSAGVVVGGAKDSAGVSRAVRWSGGSIVDLNTEIPAGSGWQLQSAAAINDNGWIVGSGVYNGVDRGFLLIPDTTPPSISCGSADGLWHAANVAIGCTASDSGSGLANPADASFSLSTSVAAGTESANASTGTRAVCDIAGNCATAGPVTGNKIDRKGPSITITVPASTTYTFMSLQLASYACNDGGSGVASCSGPVANGTAIDTATIGVNSFNVTATDAVGNTSSTAIQYDVVATSWAQFHYGADRIGVQGNEYILDTSNVGGLQLDWSAPTGASIFSSPAVVDGVVYVASTDGHRRAGLVHVRVDARRWLGLVITGLCQRGRLRWLIRNGGRRARRELGEGAVDGERSGWLLVAGGRRRNRLHRRRRRQPVRVPTLTVIRLEAGAATFVAKEMTRNTPPGMGLTSCRTLLTSDMFVL